MSFLTSLVNGLSLGSIYAIIALGYTMVYGIAKMLNFAHGDFIMVGSYIIFRSFSAHFSELERKKWRTSRSVMPNPILRF